MAYSYTVPDREAERIAAWQHKHTEEEHHNTKNSEGSIGGRYSVCFTATSLGNIIGTRCTQCDVSTDVTDYSEW